MRINRYSYADIVQRRFQTEGTAVPETMTAEVLEARLIDFFHGDFMKLLTHFRYHQRSSFYFLTTRAVFGTFVRRVGGVF